MKRIMRTENSLPSTVLPRAAEPRDNSLGAALFGKGQRAVLGLLFTHPGQRFYVREIARATGTTASVLQRDLAALASAGVLARETEGRQVYYRADPRCPIFEELKGIAVKTFGVGDVLRAMLAPHGSAVRVAFLYGSLAAGTQEAGSDIDLMIIGSLDTSAIAAGLLAAEQRLGRAVNPTLYTEAEFRAARAARQPFLDAVLSRPLILVAGDPADFERLTRG